MAGVMRFNDKCVVLAASGDNLTDVLPDGAMVQCIVVNRLSGAAANIVLTDEDGNTINIQTGGVVSTASGNAFALPIGQHKAVFLRELTLSSTTTEIQIWLA